MALLGTDPSRRVVSAGIHLPARFRATSRALLEGDSAQRPPGPGSMRPSPAHAAHLGAQPQSCALPPHGKPAATVPAEPRVLRWPLGQPILRSRLFPPGPRAELSAHPPPAESAGSPLGCRGHVSLCHGLTRSLGGGRTRLLEMPLVTGNSPGISEQHYLVPL